MIFGPLSTTTYTVRGTSFDMVRLPPGRFVDGENEARRELLVSRPFELGLTPVTQALWRAVTGSSPSYFKAEDQPVENVSWRDVYWFLIRLMDLGLTGFRLPTEAEWAWAARCGAPTRWPGADRVKPVAVFDAGQTGVVAGRKTDPAGIFDLSGSVRERVADWYQDLPSPEVDPEGPTVGTYRVDRGDAWAMRVTSVTRITNRGYDSPSTESPYLGFRLLRVAT